MNSSCKTLALLLALGLLGAGTAAAQDWLGKGRVFGRVEDQDGNPLEGATVKLHQAGNPEVGPPALTTDKKGKFSYLGLRNGAWTALVELDGYVPIEGTDNVSEFAASKPWVFSLRKIPPEELYEERAAAAMGKLDTGNALLEQGLYSEARAAYEEAMPDLEVEHHPAILLGVARSYHMEQNTEMSISTLERALEINPGFVPGLKLISNILIAEGRESEAQAYMDKLPATEALDPNAYLNVGIDHYNANRLDEALEQFEKVVADFPDNPEGYWYRGLVWLAKQQNDGAKADLLKYLELVPEGSHATEAKQFLEYLGN